mmetsp:Transcript_15062/g.45083  ORF Transcript_15062/g.45083 Transcript_15062/m.45083 type:complete len:210 (+) Transcript_15062:426-1055(+)
MRAPARALLPGRQLQLAGSPGRLRQAIRLRPHAGSAPTLAVSACHAACSGCPARGAHRTARCQGFATVRAAAGLRRPVRGGGALAVDGHRRHRPRGRHCSSDRLLRGLAMALPAGWGGEPRRCQGLRWPGAPPAAPGCAGPRNGGGPRGFPCLPRVHGASHAFTPLVCAGCAAGPVTLTVAAFLALPPANGVGHRIDCSCNSPSAGPNP